MSTRHDFTELLNAFARGEPEVGDRLLPLIYDELKALAATMFRQERANHTLQPTALVHEAYLKLAQSDTPATSRAHFLALAAKIMRQLLIDHARSKRARKRGGDSDRERHSIMLEQTPAPDRLAEADVIDLDEAMRELAAQYPRSARVVELRFFGGLSNDEIAEVLGVGRATVERDWAVARGWLTRRMRESPGDDISEGGPVA